MRNKLFLILFLSLSSFSQQKEKVDTKQYTFKDINSKWIKDGELDKNQLTILKEYLKINFNKNLDSIGYLTIAYLQPKKDCWYDNHRGIKNKEWYDAKNFEPYMNTQLIFSHHDKKKSKFSIWDEKEILYKIFPVTPETCDYTVTINKKGVYLYNPGHFDISIANAFYNELKVHE